jgi:DNA-binding NtrC family response regulator
VRLITLTRSTQAGAAARSASGAILHALYYRLSGVQLRMPSLKERGADLCDLVTQLVRELEPPARTLRDLTPAAFHALVEYGFPGNVRELRWILEHALALAEGGPIDVVHLPEEVIGEPTSRAVDAASDAEPA